MIGPNVKAKNNVQLKHDTDGFTTKAMQKKNLFFFTHRYTCSELPSNINSIMLSESIFIIYEYFASVCLCVCLFMCLFVYVSVCLCVCLLVCLFVCFFCVSAFLFVFFFCLSVCFRRKSTFSSLDLSKKNFLKLSFSSKNQCIISR